jgi:hypothetical protein
VLWNQQYERAGDQLIPQNCQTVINFFPLLDLDKVLLPKVSSFCIWVIAEVMQTIFWLSFFENWTFHYLFIGRIFISNISDLRYFIISNLNTVLPEITKWSASLLTIPTTIVSVKHAFCALKRAHTNLHSTQTREKLTKLSLITTEKNILQGLKNILNFCDSVFDIFNEKSCAWD